MHKNDWSDKIFEAIKDMPTLSAAYLTRKYKVNFEKIKPITKFTLYYDDLSFILNELIKNSILIKKYLRLFTLDSKK